MIRNVLITLFSAAILFACSEKEQAPAPTGSIKLGYRVDQVQLKSGFAADTIIPASKPRQLVITVHDSKGRAVLNGERYDLIKIGDEYYSKSILFKTGEYTLEEFIVVDSTDEAMYVAPKTGSRLAGFVDDPLPQSFEVQKESESEVKVQVVPAYLASASDFGYASFPFEVVMPATGVKHLGLCGTYVEDKKRLDACYGSKASLIGSWWFKGFIEMDSCIVENPDSVLGIASPGSNNRPWIELDSSLTPWIKFTEANLFRGESMANIFYFSYKIDQSSNLIIREGPRGLPITETGEPQWGTIFLDLMFGVHNSYKNQIQTFQFVSFNDTLFLYNARSKFLFVKSKIELWID